MIYELIVKAFIVLMWILIVMGDQLVNLHLFSGCLLIYFAVDYFVLWEMREILLGFLFEMFYFTFSDYIEFMRLI